MSLISLKRLGDGLITAVSSVSRAFQTGAAIYKGIPKVLSYEDTVITLMTKNIFLKNNFRVTFLIFYSFN